MVVKRPSRKTLVVGLVVTALSAAGARLRHAGRGRLGARSASSGSPLGALGLFIGIAAIAPRLVRPLAHVVGLPGRPPRRRRRAARAGERDPQPGPDRLDGGRADDRAHARLVRRRLRQGAARERRDNAPQAARHEPRDHLAERLGHRVPSAPARLPRAAPGVELASSIRSDRGAAHGRRRGRRQRRRPGDDRDGPTTSTGSRARGGARLARGRRGDRPRRLAARSGKARGRRPFRRS